jgi:hypothetical protein
MKSYNPQKFRPEEFLSPVAYNTLGESGLYLLMDWRILWTMDALRKRYASPITINDYHAGGKFTQRGFRDDPGTGAEYSQHRFGRACDFDIKGVPAEAFREAVRAKRLRDELQYITRIEDGVGWCHIDCAGVPGDEIIFFKS